MYRLRAYERRRKITRTLENSGSEQERKTKAESLTVEQEEEKKK